MSYELTSPIASLELPAKPPRWLIVAWFLANAVFTVALVYIYAIIAPAYLGFKTTALVGIALTAMGAITR